jgi:uncharacterized protein (DUF58 family)
MAGWQPTRALRRVVGLVCLLLIAAVVLGRADLVALAAPLLTGTLWALRRTPDVSAEVAVAVSDTQVGEGEQLDATVSVSNPGRVRFAPVSVDVRNTGWLATTGESRPIVTVLPAGRAVDVAVRLRARRWGRYRFAPGDIEVSACEGLLVHRPRPPRPVRIRVHPVNEHFEADEAMPRAAALAGTHRSRRPGEGGELVGVRRFVPGDRLRRIDWRVSLRTRELHVVATLSDRDAEVVLLLDTLHEAGVSGGVDGPASVLDVTVRGAASVAEHYLHRGDRVSLLEFGYRHRQLRAAGGRLHYQVVRDWLLDTRVVPGALEPEDWLARPNQLPPNALIVAFTPLLDERSAELLARLAWAGRSLIAVDTLPPRARPAIRSAWREPATRLWLLERQNTIDELRGHGVPVVAWRGSGSLDEVLRDVSRIALTSRPVPR